MFYASRSGEGLANSDIAALKVAVIDCLAETGKCATPAAALARATSLKAAL